MNTRQKIAQELLMKEERISAWEEQGLIDKNYCNYPGLDMVEEWHI
ncbi:MAG: hypothetical protein ACP5N1_06865 [Candidatus Woesearchaeota archaeon]